MGGNLSRRFGFDGDLNVRVERSLALMQKNVVVVVQQIRSDVTFHGLHRTRLHSGGNNGTNAGETSVGDRFLRTAVR